MKSSAQRSLSDNATAIADSAWIRRGLALAGLIVLTFVLGGVVAAILPIILSNALETPAATISLDVTTAAMFLLFSLLRALFAARLVDHELAQHALARWVARSIAVEFGVLYILASLVPLLPLPFSPAAERIWAMACALGGGLLVGFLQRQLFVPQARASVLWIAASALGWLLALALTTAVA